MRTTLILTLITLLLSSCNSDNEQTLASFEVFCEMVANEAKPISLSQPMEKEELDQVWEGFQSIAESYGVSLYRESDFPVTSLFSSSVTEGKEVVIIYKDLSLVRYQQFKQDLPNLEDEAAARTFGRLLGYTSQGINDLLMKTTDFRTLERFDVNRQITHLYFANTEEARSFYSETLGLPAENDSTFQIGKDALIQLHGFNTVHPEGQNQSTAIALLTDQLPEWYAYAQDQEISIKYTYKPREGGPHDGFVAIDPGGYLLEFEEFKQHPENELFMAALDEAPLVETGVESLNFFGSITWTYHNDLLIMQQFYEEVLGFTMVADQGWTKIYQTSPSGFIGLVDERRGMMDYADEKAVEIEWQLNDLQSAQNYFSTDISWNSDFNGLMGPEKYRYRIQ